MENSELKIASHRNFYNATLYVKCEEKDGAIYWYGDNSDNLKKITTRTTRGCGRISRYVGNPWKRISKKAAAEILAKYGITAEQFIAYTNEEPELMSELAAQRAEEERVETLNFFLSLPLTSNEALEVATQAEIELAERNAEIELANNDYQPQTNWENPHDFTITGDLSGRNINDRIIAQNIAREQEIEKNKSEKKMIIAIERTEEKMTIAIPTIGAANKGKAYFVDGVKTSKATAELMIQSYVLAALKDGHGATIEIDTRLADEFKAITSSPYKGEFAIIYTDKDGKPVEVAAEKQSMSANGVDTTPYHVEIKMCGGKVPMFEILRDGRNIFSKRVGYTFRKSEVDELIIKAYQMRKQYPNMTIELPEAVAALHLDSFACNPRIVRELNVTLIGMTDYELTQNEQYNKSFELTDRDRKAALKFFLRTPLVTIEAQDAATQAEIELATADGITPEILTLIRPFLASNATKQFRKIDVDPTKRGIFVTRAKACDKWICEGLTLDMKNIIRSVEIEKTTSLFGKRSVFDVAINGSDERGQAVYIPLKYFKANGKDNARNFAEELIKRLENRAKFANKAAVKQSENFTEAQSNLPSGDITVASGAEAFALAAKYFPNGLDFDGIEYGYRGETHFCFFNESSNMTLFVASDEENRRIEYLQILNHKANSPTASWEERHPLTVRIESKKNIDKPLVKMSKVKKTSEAKKAADDAEKNLKTSQKTVAADKSQRWLENAKTDAAGRYYIVPELAYKNFEANANWNPCFYIVTNEFKLKRVGLKFAVALAKLGQAIEISKNDVAALKK